MKYHIEKHIDDIPTSTLAYVGDSNYEFLLRMWVINHYDGKPGLLHRVSISFANAGFQANLARYLIDNKILTSPEEAVLYRGRNSNPGAMAKNQTPADYRLATGLETLIGWLNVRGEEERIQEILISYWDKHEIEEGHHEKIFRK